MKILLVAPQPFYQERGTPIAVRLLVETLCAAGHEVDLLVYHEGESVQVPGLRIFRIPAVPGLSNIPIGISMKKLACDALLCLQMAKLMMRQRYDVVHAVEESIFPAVFYNLFARKRLVCDMDSLLSQQLVDKWTWMRPLGALLRVIERAAIRRSDRVLAVCEDLAVYARGCIPAEQVTVLPDVPLPDRSGSTTVESLRAFVPRDAVLALYVGNLERYQGVGLLLEGMAQLGTEESLRLVVVGGEAAHVEAHREQAARLGIANQVVFLGPRPVAALPRYLAQADILVSPRILGQNTPMKVYSYMEAGKAILATRIRSHLQVLDEDCAVLVEPHAADVAAGLRRLLEQPELRQSLGQAAAKKVQMFYSLAAFRQKLVAVYAGLTPIAEAPCSET